MMLDSPLADRIANNVLSMGTEFKYVNWRWSYYPLTVQDWEDNVTTWPNITYSKICAYFVDSIAIDGKAMDNLKASEAYQYLHSNKVGCVLSYKHDRFVK